MTCASCVVRVERALKAVPGVEEAHVNLVTGRASVAFDPAAATEAALTRAVEDAGYAVPRAAAARTTSVELPIAGMTCANCVRRIEKTLRAVPGVSEASVNLVTQRATVSFAPDTTSPRALVDAITTAGYAVPNFATAPAARAEAATRAEAVEQSEQREQRGLRRDFFVAATLSVPLLVVAMSHGAIPGTEGTFGRWLQFFLATPVVFGPGRRFLRLAWKALRHGAADMNTLVSIGTLAAWIYSTIALTLPGLFPHAGHGVMPHLYYEAAAAILSFVLLGKLLETRARRRLSDAVRGLVALVPKTARRISDGREDDVPVESLVPGDHVLVRPGERIPSDGVIVRGMSAVDESMLTGESIPVDKTTDAQVFGGTLNQSGALVVQVTHTGGETALARIVEAVEQAQGSRAPIARLADVVSSYFVPLVLAIASVTLLAWIAVPLLTPVDMTTAIVAYALAGLYLVWQRHRGQAGKTRKSDFERMGEIASVRPSVHAMRTELDPTDRRLMAIDHHLNTPNDELAREIEALREEK